MTPLSSNVATITDPVQGRVKRLGGTGAAAGWHMGANELYGDWTYAVNLKVPSSVTGRVQLFDSRTGTRFKPTAGGPLATQASSIDFALTGSGEVGFVNNGTTTSFGYRAPRDQYVQLVFVSHSGETQLYADGVQVASVPTTLPVPRAWFAATRNVELQGMQMYAQALTAAEVQAQAGTVPQPQAVHCQPKPEATPAEPLEPATDFVNITTTAKTYCVGRVSRLEVTVRNDDTAPVRVRISTEFGTQSFERVVPGLSLSHPFTIPNPAISAGTVSVTATGHAPLSSGSATETAGYNSLSCA